MRPRSAKLVCLLALFCAFGAVDALAGTARGSCRDCASLRILLMQVASVANARPAHSPAPPALTNEVIAAAAGTQPGLPWAMRPPAAHSAQVHAVTATAGL